MDSVSIRHRNFNGGDNIEFLKKPSIVLIFLLPSSDCRRLSSIVTSLIYPIAIDSSLHLQRPLIVISSNLTYYTYVT